MPQMAPLTWSILMIMFSLLLIFSLVVLTNQTSINPGANYTDSGLSLKKEILSWKW